MLLSIDYDLTYTEDPIMWDQFIDLATKCGHTIICCTMRYPEEGLIVEENLKNKVSQIIYTSRNAKLPYLQELGITVNVWIDDSPHWLFQNSI